jgi:hypothetical protein
MTEHPEGYTRRRYRPHAAFLQEYRWRVTGIADFQLSSVGGLPADNGRKIPRCRAFTEEPIRLLQE